MSHMIMNFSGNPVSFIQNGNPDFLFLLHKKIPVFIGQHICELLCRIALPHEGELDFLILLPLLSKQNSKY